MLVEVIKIISLKKLNLQHNEISSIALQNLPTLVNIKCLVLSLCKNVTVDVIKSISKMSLSELRISCCDITDESLEIISRITTLSVLDISFNLSITVEGLDKLYPLRTLKLLSLSSCLKVTLASSSSIFHLGLTQLNVSMCNLDDKSFKAICTSTSLRYLDISMNNEITSEALIQLSCLINLQCLNVSDVSVTAEVFRAISNIDLKYLFLSGCDIDDECIKVLCRITSLILLDISCNMRITSDSLSSIRDLNNLKTLFMTTCQNVVSEELHGKAQISKCECVYRHCPDSDTDTDFEFE